MRHELSDEAIQGIQADLFAGRRIPAIKSYREATGVGLAEALAFINALEERLRQESPARFTAPPRKSAGCVLMMACFLAVLVAVAVAATLLGL